MALREDNTVIPLSIICAYCVWVVLLDAGVNVKCYMTVFVLEREMGVEIGQPLHLQQGTLVDKERIISVVDHYEDYRGGVLKMI